MELAAHAEGYSNHPISRSIKKAYGRDIDYTRIAATQELSGYGVRAEVDGQAVLAGNGKLMASADIPYRESTLPGTVVHVAAGSTYMGHIVISDEVRPDSAHTVKALRQQGIKKTVMLTGDRRDVGERVAGELGLDEVHTELLPSDKVQQVEKLLAEKSTSGRLVFVGDGLNDAPVLSRADIGIAMGGLGSDAALEAADIVLMDDAPSKIITALKISRKTRRIVIQNIVLALGVKAAVLVLGALGLANMWQAIFADVGVLVIAVLNAARALNVKALV